MHNVVRYGHSVGAATMLYASKADASIRSPAPIITFAAPPVAGVACVTATDTSNHPALPTDGGRLRPRPRCRHDRGVSCMPRASRAWLVASSICSLSSCRVVFTTGRAWSRRVLMQSRLDTKLNRRRHLRRHLVTSSLNHMPFPLLRVIL